MTIFVFIIVNLATFYTALYGGAQLKPKTTNLEMERPNTKEEHPTDEAVVKVNGNIQQKKSILPF